MRQARMRRTRSSRPPVALRIGRSWRAFRWLLPASRHRPRQRSPCHCGHVPPP
jgi:hypothetical protein